MAWSGTQLLLPVLPIRLNMTNTAQKARLSSLASIALVLASPAALAGQSLSARPAAVALTVVVPPHAPREAEWVTERAATVVRRTAIAVDLETMVRLGDRAASRIEVRLGAPLSADSSRVWIQNQDGAFEPLVRSASIVAVDVPPSSALPQSSLHFRIESSGPSPSSSVSIPVEYRVTVGAGDEIAVWSFPAVLKFDAARGTVGSGATR